MQMFRCRFCSGDLVIEEGKSTCRCEYCGALQPVPSLDSEKKLNLLSRAGRLREANQFDKAAGVYESVAAEFPQEAEAFWGLVLCKYGIEYVDSPKTGERVPTCHRTSFDSVLEDPNTVQALNCADPVARELYQKEAESLEALRLEVLAVSSREEPYDIFISYKEKDDITGSRTVDSVIAQKVYNELTEAGYRVFFSRVTLEDRLGQNYEPIIFAALHSARVMLVFGTRFEYFDAVWVRNEWSRYLALIARGEKKTLIPCYKDIGIDDMPAEFRPLQAQDMGEVGAEQDLLRGLEKILGKPKKAEVKENAPGKPQKAADPAPETPKRILERAESWLSMREYGKAQTEYEKMTSLWPDRWEGWWGILTSRTEEFRKDIPDADRVSLYNRTKRFCPEDRFADLQRKYAEYLRVPAVRQGNSLRDVTRGKTAILTEQRCREMERRVAEQQRTVGELREKERRAANNRTGRITSLGHDIKEQEGNIRRGKKDQLKYIILAAVLLAAGAGSVIMAVIGGGFLGLVGWLLGLVLLGMAVSMVLSWRRSAGDVRDSGELIERYRKEIPKLEAAKSPEEEELGREIVRQEEILEKAQEDLAAEQLVLEKEEAFLREHAQDFADYRYSEMCREIGVDVPFTGTVRVPDYR